MGRARRIRHRFVEQIPGSPEDGFLYVSIEYGTAVHKCCCGCGEEVVTPLSPTDWKLVYDGETVSLSPSIGNWSFKCQAHYWIIRNRVRWARSLSAEQIQEGRHADARRKREYYREGHTEDFDLLRLFDGAFTPSDQE